MVLTVLKKEKDKYTAQKMEIFYLEETNIVGVLAEALTAQVKTILANESRALSADAAREFVEKG